MVKVIMGLKGTGKTKQMIDLINTAVDTEHGNVVAIAHNSKLNYKINYKIRLVDTSDYSIPNYDTLRGFLYGLYASNYDITHVFIESLNKLVPTVGNEDVEPFLDWALDSARKEGDVDLVKTEYGWHLMYYVSTNDPVWRQSTTAALQNQDYEQLAESATQGWNISQGMGMKLVKA